MARSRVLSDTEQDVVAAERLLAYLRDKRWAAAAVTVGSVQILSLTDESDRKRLERQQASVATATDLDLADLDTFR